MVSVRAEEHRRLCSDGRWTRISKLSTKNKRDVRLFAKKMFFQLIEFESQGCAIGNGPIEHRMSVGFLQGLFPGLDNEFSPIIIEENALRAGDEVSALQLPAVDQTEDQSIDENRFEDLSDIKVQCMAAEVGFVEVANARIEVCLIHLCQNGSVEKGVTEGDQGIGLIAGWSPGTRTERELGIDDARPDCVVGFPGVTFDCHEGGCRVSLLDFGEGSLDNIQRGLRVDIASAVVQEHGADIAERTTDESTGEGEASSIIQVVLNLAENQCTAREMLARIKSSGVITVAVEEVQKQALPGNKLQETLIEVDFAEDIELTDLLDRQEAFPLVGLKNDRVLMASKPSGREDVDRLHLCSLVRGVCAERRRRSAVGESGSSPIQQNS